MKREKGKLFELISFVHFPALLHQTHCRPRVKEVGAKEEGAEALVQPCCLLD